MLRIRTIFFFNANYRLLPIGKRYLIKIHIDNSYYYLTTVLYEILP